MDAAVPAVEIANDADAARIGRPNSPVNTTHACELADMRSHFFVGAEVCPFAKQVQIKIGEQRGKRVGVLGLRGRSAGPGDAEAIVARSESFGCGCGKERLEES